MRHMGPFEHSTEREFALTVNHKAIDDCTSLTPLRSIAKDLLQGWCALQTALQSLMLENIKLRQALDARDNSLRAADERLTQIAAAMQQHEQKLQRANKRPWPFG